jgi:hypothetical protein
MNILLSTVREAISLEPELPGGMPNDMWDAIRNDRDACEKAMKMTVASTKAGIKERLANIINSDS